MITASMVGRLLLGLLLLHFNLNLPCAHAYENEGRGYLSIEEATKSFTPPGTRLTLDPETRLAQFEKALSILEIPAEPKPDFSDFPAGKTLTHDGILANAQWIDPDQGLRRYLHLEDDAVSLFKTYFSESLPDSLLDFTTALSGSEQKDSASLMAKLNTISDQVKNSDSYPLDGFKILIDPGHMGTPDWDEQTGKFVKYDGLKVSEGEINLWTSLLVAKKLEALGATVKLTRTESGTVSDEKLDTYDATPFINSYFYNAFDSDWIQKYLVMSDDTMAAKLPKEPRVKVAYTAQKKIDMYITGEDLEARSRIIDAFKPDLVLDIHFDAEKLDQIQSSVNSVEAFVPGAFRNFAGSNGGEGTHELGSRAFRSFALHHLLETRRWNESVNMAQSITKSVSDATGVPLLSSRTLGAAVRVKDGVYARNLYITRRARSGLVVYLECLHYDHESEFYHLAHADREGSYHDLTFQYPSRLDAISDGVSAGIVNYFK